MGIEITEKSITRVKQTNMLNTQRSLLDSFIQKLSQYLPAPDLWSNYIVFSLVSTISIESMHVEISVCLTCWLV